jgi:dienelactone hydrolase
MRWRTAVLAVLAVLAGANMTTAAVRTEVIEYRHGDVVLEGFLACDGGAAGKRPGVLICHEWTGHNPYVRKRAEQLAGLGYAAFALDMYGKGVLAKSRQEAVAKSSVFKKDRALMRSRAGAGLDVLRKHPRVDAKRLAAMGYCFGGTCVLELARGGADVAGVVSFHGDLTTPTPLDAKNIKGSVLALHGADDPFVPPKDVAAFEKEMRDAGVDWQLVKYGGAVHSFTNPGAGSDVKSGAAYNAKADARSWQAMRDFFAELFPEKK